MSNTHTNCKECGRKEMMPEGDVVAWVKQICLDCGTPYIHPKAYTMQQAEEGLLRLSLIDPTDKPWGSADTSNSA